MVNSKKLCLPVLTNETGNNQTKNIQHLLPLVECLPTCNMSLYDGENEIEITQQQGHPT